VDSSTWAKERKRKWILLPTAKNIKIVSGATVLCGIDFFWLGSNRAAHMEDANPLIFFFLVQAILVATVQVHVTRFLICIRP
jgi:hypothetical protein